MNPGAAVVRAELDRLVTLIEVSRSLTAELDLPDIIRRILEGAIRVIPAAEAGILFLYDHERHVLAVSHAVGFGPRVYDLVLRPGEGLSGHAFSTRRAAIYTHRDAVVTAMEGAGDSNLEIFAEASGGTDYPQSALSAPLVYKGEALGAMVVENLYRPAVFQPFDVRLLDALAQSAAIAIVNARLYAAEHASRVRLETLNQEVSRQRDELERRLHVQDSLAAVVRDDLPLSALATRLAGIVRGSVLVADALYRLRASDTAAHAESVRDLGLAPWDRLHAALRLASRTRAQQRVATDAGGLLVCPVSSGPETLGFVLVDTPGREPDAIDKSAADSAALIAAAQLLRERAAQEGEIRRRGHLLDQLLSGERPEGLASLPQVQPPLRLVVGTVHPAAGSSPEAGVRVLRAFLAITQEAMEGQHRPVMVTARDGAVVAIQSWAGAAPDGALDDLSTLDEAAARLERLAPEWRAAYAVEDGVQEAAELAAAHQETRIAIALRERLGRTDRVFAVRSLGAYRLIMRAVASAHVVDLCVRTLRPVLDHDRRNDAALLATFSTYLELSSSLKATAERLGVHPHTVDYRLGRLQELTGLDLRRAEDRLTLELAVRVLDTAGLRGFGQ